MRQPLRILSLEDDPRDAELIQESLEAEGISCEMTRVDTQSAFQASVQRANFDLILADYTLPSFDGISALKMARSACPDVPFIFVTGTLGEEVAIESLKIGATDFVLKTRLSRLAPSILRSLREAGERAERKRAEEALRRNEAYSTEAQTLSHTGSFGWNVASGEIYWSEETFKIFGLEQSVKPSLQFIVERTHPGDRDLAKQTIESAAASSTNFDVKHRLLMPDGSIKYIHVLARAMETSPGNLEFVGAVSDISERKRAEEALRSSENNLRRFVDSVPGLQFALSSAGKIEFANRPLLEYFGKTIEELDSWSTNDAIHPDDLQTVIDDFRRSMANGTPFNHELRYRRADRVYRWSEAKILPVRDTDGRITGWYGLITDIEDRKQAEGLRDGESRILEMIARDAPLQEILENLVRIVEAQFAGLLCSVLLLDEDGRHVRHGAAPSLPEAYIKAIDGLAIGPRAGSCGTAMFRKEPVVVTDILQDPLWEPYRIVAERNGLRACWSTPILAHSGKVLGSFAMYYREPRSPCPPENRATEMATHLAGIAIERKLTHERLQRSEDYLAQGQTLSRTGSFGWNVSSGDIYWSEETYKIFDCERTVKPTLELVFQRIHPDDRDFARQTIEHAIGASAGFDVEHRLLMPDGSTKHVHDVARALQTSPGNLEFVGAITDITAAKRAETKLRESEAYLAEAQRLSHTGSWAWNPATAITTYMSEECYRILGLDPQGEMLSLERALQRIHPDDRGILADKVERATHERAEFELDYRFCHPGGEFRDIHQIGHPVLSPSGDLVEYVGTLIDVTERKRAEDKIRQSETELRQLVDAIPQQVFVFSPDWSPLFANQQERDYTGLGSEQVRSKDAVASVFHPEDLGKLEALRERGNLEAAPFELEARIKGKDGQYRWFLIRDNPLLDEKGQILRWYGTRTDITGRKLAEEMARQSENELRHILDFAPQHVAVLGPDRSTLYLNRVLLDYFGRTLDDFLSLERREFIEPSDWERLSSETQTKFLSGVPHEAEIRLRRKDGTYRWFVFHYSPLRDEQGRITRWYVAGTDIDDRKQAEQQLQSENIALREEIDRTSMYEEIVGSSPAIRTVLSRVSRVAPTDSTVMINGETGTGKELIARAVHKRSQRSSRPFVSVNCAAIPRDLIASELFGHEKGAFTGAIQRRIGRFELAEGGTIFLDEIGELPAETQVALLRVLQEREFERIGGKGSIRTNVRVIAATNRDLQAAIASGKFRSDLYYRLNVFPIEVPPLRQRPEDIPMLVGYFIDRFARKTGKTIRSVSKKSLDILHAYPWPGNIRELQNVIERSIILCESETFSVDESWLTRQPVPSEVKSRPELPQKLATREKEMIEAALRECGGRVSGPAGAAIKLGIPGSTLDSKIRSLGIDKNRFKTSEPSTDRT
jgi:formate hydrogenlyase transcriptional activator